MCMALYTAFLLLNAANGLLMGSKLPQYSKNGRSLVLAGGALHDNAVFDKIVELAGGEGVARIGVVAASSSDPEDSYQYYRGTFLGHGAKDVSFIAVSESKKYLNSDPVTVSLVRNQTGFFFTGGDQSRVIDSLFLGDRVASLVLTAIRERFDQGAVISGSSAGTACQTAAVMIAGGMSWDALRYGAFTSHSDKYPDDLVYDQNGGLGFLQNAVLDTHFSERGREGRLIRLLSDTRNKPHGANRGIGVDENTALVITHANTPNETGVVMGENGVVVVDVSKSVLNTSSRYFTIKDVRMSYLTNGDSIRLSDLDVTFATSKSPLSGHEYYNHALTSNDIFNGDRANPHKKGEFVRVATSVFDAKYDTSSYGTTYEKKPRFRVTVSRSGGEARGYIKRGHSFEEDIISYHNLRVSIEEN